MTDSHSPNLPEELKQQLQELVPAAFKDGQLDVETLKRLLGSETTLLDERYGLNWAGKADSYKALQYPTSAALRPRLDQSVDFEHAQHVFIEGENLEVLKTLQRAYFGKVKMIYIDPPYNTGNDNFIYPDRFQESREDYLKRIDSLDIDGNITKEGLFRKNSKDNGHYHSNWLSMMLPRLYLARNLLRDDGVIFISIDDNEQSNLKLLCDEIFGEENFVDTVIWKKRYGGGAKEKHLVSLHEYVLFYSKNINQLEEIFVPLEQDSIDRYYKLKDEKFDKRGAYRTHPLEAGKAMDERKKLVFPIIAPDGIPVNPKKQWLWSKQRVLDAIAKNELEFIKGKDGSWSIHTKQYLRDENGNLREAKVFSIIDDVFTQHGTNEIIDIFGDAKIFNYPKPTAFIRKLLDFGTKTNDIILDFFAGSGSTAQAVMELNLEDGGNRQYICVQMPELTDEDSEAYVAGYKNIADISRERIRRVIDRIKNKADLASPVKENDSNLGFRAFELAPSNFKQWRGDWAETAEELDQQLALMLPTEKFGATPLDMAFELLLKNGRPLVSHIEFKTIVDISVYIAWTQEDESEEKTVALMFVLESMQLEALPDMLAMKPKHMVFLDSVFNNNDSMKVNVALHCDSAGIKFSSI